jgi:hypothetical protein
MASIMIDPGDPITGDLQFQFGQPAAIEQSIRKQEKEAATPTRPNRLSCPTEIVDPKTHCHRFLASEALFNPFSVPPSYPSDVENDAEKNHGNKDPPMLTE